VGTIPLNVAAMEPRSGEAPSRSPAETSCQSVAIETASPHHHKTARLSRTQTHICVSPCFARRV
jgi:hypothetical protein